MQYAWKSRQAGLATGESVENVNRADASGTLLVAVNIGRCYQHHVLRVLVYGLPGRAKTGKVVPY